MRQLFLFIFAFTSFVNAYTQNHIYGKISDTNGETLTGCSIYIPELNKGTVADKDGNYKFDNLPNGKFKFQFSFIGYNLTIKTLTLTGEKINLNIKLEPSVIHSQEVVVTGGYVSAQHDNAVKISVLKNRKLVLEGTPNLMEAISQEPGVDMISKGQGVAKPVIRGLSMNNILVLNNGVRIENYQFSENHPLGVDNNSIDRIEIIKGPASLVYGSDAIGGVLNFVKENPAPKQTIQGDYNGQYFTNTNGYSNNFGVKGASKSFFGGVRIGQKSHEDYLQGGGEFVPNSRFNEKTINLNAGITKKIGTFKLFYDYFKQDLGMTVPPAIKNINSLGRKNDIWYQDLEHQLLSSQNKIYLGRYKLELNAAFQNALRKLNTTAVDPTIEMNLQTISYETKLYLPSNENSEYIIGIQGSSQENRNLNNRVDQFLPDANINNIGVLALVNYTILRKIKLQTGIRYDINQIHSLANGTEGTEHFQAPVNNNYNNINASLGATYNANEKLILRFNLAKAYRTPNLSELTSNGMHGNRYEIGNTNLKPQEAYESDLSMHYHSKFLSLDIAGFYNSIQNFIYISPTADTSSSGQTIYQYQQNNANLYGGEAGMHFHPERLDWLHIQGTYAMVYAIQDNGDFLPFIPANKFRYNIKVCKKKLAFMYQPSIKLSFLTALQQNNPSPFETKTNGYTLINLSFMTDIKMGKQKLSFAIAANNLLDQQYIDHLSTLKPLGYYNEGRNITLSVRIPFGVNL